MNYVISDVHGRDDLFFKLLDQIKFSNEDRLFVLGDVVDRGPGSIKILKHIMANKNIIMLKGNHEIFLINYFEKFYTELYMSHPWMNYGGLDTYNEIMQDPNPETTFRSIYNFIRDLPVIYVESINGIKYYMAHAKIDVCDKKVSPFQSSNELLWGDISDLRPIILNDKSYIITGHLRADMFNTDGSSNILFDHSWILMDGGCGFENAQLNCLRLEDFKIFIEK